MSKYLRRKMEDFLATKDIEKVRKAQLTNLYPPMFDEERWKKSNGCNCYSYALDIPVKGRIKQIWIPGLLSDPKFDGRIWSAEELISNVKADLFNLGFSYRENDTILNDGEWRIAIYYIPTYHDMPIGFHFVRQDEDGSWSQKRFWNSRVEIIKEKDIVPPDLSEDRVMLCKTLIIGKVNN